MEQRFSNNSLDLEMLWEFCKREGEVVTYYTGDQLEREGDPARWLAYVESGCSKYVNHGINDREHITDDADGAFGDAEGAGYLVDGAVQFVLEDEEGDLFLTDICQGGKCTSTGGVSCL